MSSAIPITPSIRLERVACPLCGASSRQVVFRGADELCGIPGLFHVEQCENCQHLFMNPQPVTDCLADCYPAHYAPHQSTTTSEPPTDESAAAIRANSRPWYLRYLPLRHVPGLRSFYFWLVDDKSQPLPVAPDVLTKSRPRAFEIGCSTGGYLWRLNAACWEVIGIEPGTVPAATARESGLDVITGTVESTQLPAESFDAAAAWMVIEHVPNPRSTVTAMRAALKPGGQLLISVPNAGCWERHLFGRSWYAWEPPRHLQHFSSSSLRRLLTECGFEHIDVIHQRNSSYIVGSMGLAWLRCFPRSRIGRWLKHYPDRPTLLIQLLLAPFAHLLAALNQGGRLTVLARRGRDN